MLSRLRNLGRNTASLAWAESTAAFYGFTGMTRAVLYFIATNTSFRLWRKFFMSIDTIRRALGCCRSSVEKALKTLRDTKVISYDGQVHVGKRRPVAVYRLTGTPDCPLPQWVVEAREAEREASVALFEEGSDEALTCSFTYRAEQEPRLRHRTAEGERVVQDHLQTDDPPEVYPSALLTKTGPQATPEPSIAARRPTYVRHGEENPAPRREYKGSRSNPADRLRKLAARLLGLKGTPTPEPSLRGPEEGSGTVSGAGCAGGMMATQATPLPVTYSPCPTEGAVMTPFTDPTLGALPRDTRYFYLGLRALADASGQVIADARYLKGQVFPYDDDVTPGVLEDMIEILVLSGKAHQVPGHLVLSDVDQPTDVLFPAAALLRPDYAMTDPATAFEAFWRVWPRRQGKGAARRAFVNAVGRGVDPDTIIASAASYAQRCRDIGKEAQFIPHPATWLNQERYDDDPEAMPEVRSKVDDAFRQNMAMVEHYRQQELGGGGEQKAIGW